MYVEHISVHILKNTIMNYPIRAIKINKLHINK